ncbi:hypothetical protein L1274_001158 [Duganella sp. HSC-15S17]|uniref:DUF3455 domain-containing protein n=1 Tax=Duganella violaceipulchra TaxID=2849652 RepID=A0ABT1GEW3_9BURK|nr:DUF3455 domain-containing protein [Duganella violaceicalia]MCP2007465.1 hypothetical protein [Duganella violaceicalia]
MTPLFSISLATALWTAVAVPALAHGGAEIAVPANLQSSATHGQALELHARGVQIYVCTESPATPGKFEWTFSAPEAALFDASGTLVGKHFSGPTWQSLDGSTVVAAVTARHDAPAASDIPWLLLEARKHSGGGVFGSVSAIQRVATQAGKAPAEGCDREHPGSMARVPYQAIYRIYSTM